MTEISGNMNWPKTPACYEWLSLDRRGNWRLQGERVTHRGLIDFLNKQYASDESGCWFVQNGPQRVYVDLACTPWIFRREGEAFVSHTGQPAGVAQRGVQRSSPRSSKATSTTTPPLSCRSTNTPTSRAG